MTLTPVTFERFGGLDLLRDPLEIAAGGAVALSNVDFDRLGRIRTRDGNTLIKALGATAGIGGLASFQFSIGSTPNIIVTYQTAGPTYVLEAYSAAGGAAIASATPGSVQWMSSARWGNTTNAYLYIADLGGVWRWDGTTFTQPAGVGSAKFVTVTPSSNRLVKLVADGGIQSRVRFSDPGVPETFSTNNFLDLTPGDGTSITGGIAVFGNVIVTKPDRSFVFYGESTDADGEPVFNYRPVERIGAIVQPTVGDEGAYLFDGRYVWLWDGSGSPVRISQPIEPYLEGIVSIAGETGLPALYESVRLWYSVGRLWMLVPNTSSSGLWATFVYDPPTRTWTFYSQNIGGMTTARNTIEPATFWLSRDLTATSIYRVDASMTTDDGVAIPWSYQTGRYGLADSGVVATTTETAITGTGTVTVEIDSDLYANQSASVALGSTVAEGWPAPVDNEGTWFQTTLSGAAVGSVSRLTHYVSSAKPVGVR